jgi:predicted nucleic acid-binding Zn ribbon protein
VNVTHCSICGTYAPNGFCVNRCSERRQEQQQVSQQRTLWTIAESLKRIELLLADRRDGDTAPEGIRNEPENRTQN